MAKFRYSLQNILNIKEKMETQAKQEFGMAQTALNVEIEHLERLKARKREYEEESGGLLQGKLDLRAIEENKEARYEFHLASHLTLEYLIYVYRFLY